LGGIFTAMFTASKLISRLASFLNNIGMCTDLSAAGAA